jgi:hypothetical protein
MSGTKNRCGLCEVTMSISNPRITYRQRTGVSRTQEASALAAAYAFILRCRERRMQEKNPEQPGPKETPQRRDGA